MQARANTYSKHPCSMAYSRDDVLAVSKQRDAWWTVLLTDPVAIPLVRWVANRTSITPTQITGLGFGLGVAAAACFTRAGDGWLLAGALLFQLSFVLDCADGKLARLKDNGTMFGTWLDFVFDQLRFLLCALALVGTRYAATGHAGYLFVAVLIVFCDLFRYVNSTQVAKVRRSMRRQLVEARICHPQEPALAGLLLRFADPDTESFGPPDAELAELNKRFHARFPWYVRTRDRLLGYRIRTHLVSGVEFQMAVCVIAPLTAMFTPIAIVPVTIVAGALLLVFETALVYKLWLSTRDFALVIGWMTADPTAEVSTETTTEATTETGPRLLATAAQ
jgi:phosphatidylglycerophosphate synthase